MDTGNQSGNLNTGNYQYKSSGINPSSVGSIKIPGTDQSAGGYQMPDLNAYSQNQNANSQNFNQAMNGQVGAFTGAYNAAAQALPTYQQLNERNNQQYNVEPLMQNATNLNNELLRIPSENYGMTQGSDTNQGQLDQMTGVQQFRLQPLAQNATAQAQQAQTLSNQATGYGVQNEAQLLSPYANTVPLQQGLLSGSYANFTQQQSDQLNALTQLAQSGATLSADQLNQLSALQQAKLQADATIQAANIQAANAQKVAQIQGNYVGNKYQVLNPAQTLVNTYTGASQRAR
jgi:hypothetical protein